MKKQNRGKETGQRTTNKGALIGLMIGACVAVLLFSISYSTAPTGSPKDIVIAQVVHGTSITEPMATNSAKVLSSKTVESPTTSNRSIAHQPTSPQGGKDQLIQVGFEKLSAFNFVITDEIADDHGNPQAASLKTARQIPSSVMALNDQNVAATGFMLPLKFKHRLVTEFLLLKNQNSCCFGVVPKINEWVAVKMTGEGVQQRMDQPVTIQGRLSVGEVRENGYLVGIYRLEGERMAALTQ